MNHQYELAPDFLNKNITCICLLGAYCFPAGLRPAVEADDIRSLSYAGHPMTPFSTGKAGNTTCLKVQFFLDDKSYLQVTCLFKTCHMKRHAI